MGPNWGWKEPPRRQAVLWLLGLTLVCLLPFINKPVHMDDPLFIWTAWQVRSHPLNFYGFMADWDVRPLPMPYVMQNPPLNGYYLAVVGWLFGWSEQALHFGFLLPAFALILGAYALGTRLTAHPFAVGLATLAAPVFILSATGLMCDTLMVALWVWAIFFWLEGINGDRLAYLFLAGLLIALCALTKYFGAALAPLLLAYSCVKKKRIGWSLLSLAIPILALAAYQYWTARLYGHGLLLNAAGYASRPRAGSGLLHKTPTCLAFVGGCVFISVAAVPLALGKKAFGIAIAAVAGLTALFLQLAKLEWPAALQMAIFICGGVIVLLWTGLDVWSRRSSEALLLGFWIVGTLTFVEKFNWTIAGRNILPLAPAVALLVVRRIESLPARKFTHFYWPIGVALAVALGAGWGDLKFAEAGRDAATAISHRFAGQPLAFEGHWGFQYYMEQNGAKALNGEPLAFVPNEIVAIPMNNTHRFLLPKAQMTQTDDLSFGSGPWVSIMGHGAGFYSDNWGRAPFLFGPAPEERYLIFRSVAK